MAVCYELTEIGLNELTITKREANGSLIKFIPFGDLLDKFNPINDQLIRSNYYINCIDIFDLLYSDIKPELNDMKNLEYIGIRTVSFDEAYHANLKLPYIFIRKIKDVLSIDVLNETVRC